MKNKVAGTQSSFFSNKAFTLIEVLIVLFLVGLVALPFTNMFLFGVKGSYDNAEHVLGYNLARGKMEEIKSLPWELIKSDYQNFREVFQDRPSFDNAYFKENSFEKYFTDVFTETSLTDADLKITHDKLKELYPKTYLKELKLFSEDYRFYRRVVKVDTVSQGASPARLKKVNVLVFDKDNRKIADLSSLIGQHK
jgi:prepilin-type N-terminal cleavage/methylation domain-containing protein